MNCTLILFTFIFTKTSKNCFYTFFNCKDILFNNNLLNGLLGKSDSVIAYLCRIRFIFHNSMHSLATSATRYFRENFLLYSKLERIH